MDNSPLNRLPGEIRNYIYELIFSGSEPIHIQFTTQGPSSGGFHHTPMSPTEKSGWAMLRTCKQIHEEAKDIAWSETSIVVLATLDTGALAFKELVRQVGKENLQSLQHLKIEVGVLKDTGATGSNSRLQDALKTILDSTLAICPDTRLSVRFSIPAGAIHGGSDEVERLEVDMCDANALDASIQACTTILRRRKKEYHGMSSLEATELALARCEVGLQLSTFRFLCSIRLPFSRRRRLGSDPLHCAPVSREETFASRHSIEDVRPHIQELH